jgi:hypothetical protein
MSACVASCRAAIVAWMTPDQFISKWSENTRSEAAASKEHFLDLCALLGVPTPNSDATGASYAFEKGTKKAGGGGGWADVWKRGSFGWEYKSRGGDLEKAHEQLLRYAGALENPPLLICSDMERIIVRTNWTNAVSERHELALEDLRSAAVRDRLRACWIDPERWRPTKTRQALTEEAAGEFAELATRLRSRGHDPQAVAHFVNRLVFCLFAEDVDLLPNGLVDGMLALAAKDPGAFAPAAAELFRAMRDKGGRIGFQPVPWFNGGLFDDDTALPLEAADVAVLTRAAALAWDEVDPSIFGTLFERGLDPDKRSQLGAHYTDREKIGLLVDAVVLGPLLAEWEAVKGRISTAMAERVVLLKESMAPAEAKAHALVLAGAESITAESRAAKGALKKAADRRAKRITVLLTQATADYRAFRERLRGFRVLDPACGSGNFLYLSLLTLKDLELRVAVEAEALGLEPGFPSIGPEAVLGIEINPYAAELARVSVWIGHIQWARRNGYPPPSDPVLRNLDTIECRDAVLADDGTPAAWPPANVIVGNPPFLGAKLMKRRLGAEYTERLRAAYAGRLAGFSDLVCYWFERAREQVAGEASDRAGLVATSSIRGGTNRPVLDQISRDLSFEAAWSELPWTIDGARVEVSLICFGRPGRTGQPRLDGCAVDRINPDLTTGLNLTMARPLPENRNASFQGVQLSGPHDIPGLLAREWMQQPSNPNGRGNADVLKPYWNGDDLAGRPRDCWFIDLPLRMTEAQASFFQAPYAYLAAALYDPTNPEDRRTLIQARAEARDRHARERWWEPYWPRPEMRQQIASMTRYIVTGETAEHRLFTWLAMPVVPDKNLVVIARDDDTTFGILHSRFHEAWALRQGTSLEDRPRYTSTTTFRTFPFPEGLTPDRPAADYAGDPRAQRIAVAARALVEARDRWLNPPELVDVVPEVVPGFPDRLVAKNAAAEAILKKRTLTALYNTRGTPEGAWLDNLHRELDAAVAAAYGWPEDIGEDDALARLLALNLARAGGS